MSRHFPDGLSLEPIQARFGRHFNFGLHPLNPVRIGFRALYRLRSGLSGSFCQERVLAGVFFSFKRLLRAAPLPWDRKYE